MRGPALFCLPALALAIAGCKEGDEGGSGESPGDSWATLAPLNEPRQEVGVAALGNRIYVAGGFRADRSTANTVEAYDVAANTWGFVAPMPQGLNHPAAAVVGGRLYVMGGFLGSGPAVASTFEYDPQANAWAVRAPMPSPRGAPMAAVLGGRIFVAGGEPNGRALEAYDPQRNAWESLSPMPTPRNHVAGGVVGSRFFAVGGRPPTTLNVTEAFDTATGAWATRAPMPTGRSGHGAAVVRGCLYVFGGEGNPSRPDGVFPQNEVYDPRNNTWEARAPMRTPRHGIGAAVLGDKVYIPGGGSVQGFGATAVHEVYTVPRDKSCE